MPSILIAALAPALVSVAPTPVLARAVCVKPVPFVSVVTSKPKYPALTVMVSAAGVLNTKYGSLPIMPLNELSQASSSPTLKL